MSSPWFGSTSFLLSWASDQLRLFFKPLQLHLELSDLLEQLSFLGLALLIGLCFLSAGEKLTGTLQQLFLPLAHLDRVNGVIGGNLLECLATTDRLHGDSGLELRAMGAAFAMGGNPLSGAVHRLNVNDGTSPEKPDHLNPPALIGAGAAEGVTSPPLDGLCESPPQRCHNTIFHSTLNGEFSLTRPKNNSNPLKLF